MILRKTKRNEINKILDIIEDGRSFLKDQGLDQWQDGHPNINYLINDINNNNSYVLVDNEEIVLTAAIIDAPDPNYEKIYEGAWLTNNNYLVIHRIATKKEYRHHGYADYFMDCLKNMLKNNMSIRIDTHLNNIPMQKLLEKKEFIKCGIIYLDNCHDDSHKRLAYEFKKQ